MMYGVLWTVFFLGIAVLALRRSGKAYWNEQRNGWSSCSRCGAFSDKRYSRCPSCNAKMKNWK